MTKLVDENHEQLAQNLGEAIYKENAMGYDRHLQTACNMMEDMSLVSRLALHKRMFEIALELKEKADG